MSDSCDYDGPLPDTLLKERDMDKKFPRSIGLYMII